MIPASYLYKDIYRQAWIDPDLEDAKARAAADRNGHPITDRVIAFILQIAHRRAQVRQVQPSLAFNDCA